MIRYKEKHFMKSVYLVFAVLLLVVLVVFCYRVYADEIEGGVTSSRIINLSKQYTMGIVYDCNGKEIVTGISPGELSWSGTDNEQIAFANLIGPEIKTTMNSKMTILGMASNLFGSEDDRLNMNGLLHPGQERIGGNVQLTIDSDLQNYIYQLLENNGFEKAYVIVSNYKTGDIMAAVSLPSFHPTEDELSLDETGLVDDDRAITGVFRRQLSPGSTIKPILAAVALEISSSNETFTYECTNENHVFHTQDGPFRVECAGKKEHGIMNMEDAMAVSCNGYFISLLRNLPNDKVKETFSYFGFDTVKSFNQMQYWDNSFIGRADDDGAEYLLAAIGQGECRVTPFGLHVFSTAFLAGGTVKEPRIIKATSDLPNSELKEVVLEKEYNICSQKVAEQVKNMMLGVTQNGIGREFQMKEGFAAKTGTAQKKENENVIAYTLWTTGGLITEETPYAITVCLDDIPVDRALNSASAGKLAKAILQYTLGGKE